MSAVAKLRTFIMDAGGADEHPYAQDALRNLEAVQTLARDLAAALDDARDYLGGWPAGNDQRHCRERADAILARAREVGVIR